MTSKDSSTRTAVSTQVAADGGSFSYQQIERMANAVAKSGLFGVKQPEQALALMMIAQAEGTHPATAARDYHIIQGRPALKADTMLARFQQAGGKVQWTDYTDKRVAGTFSHPSGGSLEIVWDMDRAKQAGLAGKDNWKTYPRAMLRSRVISEAVRTLFPGIAVGLYTVEEVQDIIDITPTKQQEELASLAETTKTTGLVADEVAEHMEAIKSASDAATLRAAFGSAWKHATNATDDKSAQKFKAEYEARKAWLADQAAAEEAF